MANAERPDTPESETNGKKKEDDLLCRFPSLPTVPNLPEAPKLNPKLPTEPLQRETFTLGPGYKMGLAMSAVTSFVMPILVLTIGGVLLDRWLKTLPWLTIAGVLLGFIAGTVSLMNIVRKLSD